MTVLSIGDAVDRQVGRRSALPFRLHWWRVVFVLSPGFSIDVDVDDVQVLGEALDERRYAGRTGKHRAPLLEGEVGGQHG